MSSELLGSSYGFHHRESILQGPFPVQSGLCGWCLPDEVFNKESIIYPLRVTHRIIDDRIENSIKEDKLGTICVSAFALAVVPS